MDLAQRFYDTLTSGGALPTPSGAVSGNIGAIQSWLTGTVDQLPYVLGGVGPHSFDCSGLVGEVWARLTGHPSFRRYFVTAGEQAFLESQGFKRGRGTFTVGFNSHHTMGNLAGLSFEAANHRDGILMGTHTSNIGNFPNVYYLPQLGTNFVGTGSGMNIGTGDPSVVSQLPAGVKIGDLYDYFKNLTGGVGGGTTGDASVAQIAEGTARAAGASNKMLLALIEAGLVESGMRNLNYGDRDCVGFLQQRPSQGWKDPMNVATATRSFIAKARAVDRPGYTSGQLAQKVQVSAFPGRYQQRHDDAYAILDRELPGIPAGIYDTGGILKPDHAAINRSNDDEFVFNKQQLAGMGMSEAQMRQLATMIAQALQTRPGEVKLGEKPVGEFVQKTMADALRLPG